MLTKSTDWQAVEKPARQEGEPAKKGVYPVVNDRILRATPTQQAKISADAPSSAEIFAFAGFVSGLKEVRMNLFFYPSIIRSAGTALRLSPATSPAISR